jgi:iron complex outermembrane recepter protein
MFFQKSLAATIGLSLLAFGLWAQHSLSGKISNASGEALPGATLSIQELTKRSIARQDGTYAFDNLPAGNYTLYVSYLGHETQTLKISVPSLSNLDVSLDEVPLPLDALVVKSTRVNARTPMTYSNLNSAQIRDNNQGQDMPFILQWTPSAIVSSDAGAGIGYTNIRIRGTDATRINVTVNGIPINDSESQGMFWVNMPDFASSTNDVQIQRGVGTSTNGAGAFGATINLNTAKVRQDPYASIGLSAGSFNSLRSNLRFGTGVSKSGFSFDGRLSRITSDGYIDRASSKLNSWYATAAWVKKKSLLRFNAFSGHEITYQAWNGVPANLVNDWETRTFNSAGTERPGEPYNNEVDNYRQTHYQLLYNTQVSDNWNLNLALHHTRGLGFFEQYKAEETLADYQVRPLGMGDALLVSDLVRQLWLDNYFTGGVYALNYRKDKIDFTFGGGYNLYDGDHYGKLPWIARATDYQAGAKYYENVAQKTDLNLYTKLNYSFSERWLGFVDLQVRRLGYQVEGVDRNIIELDINDQLLFFNPKAGLSYQFPKQAVMYASHAVAQREPNRNDYVDGGGNLPRPERLYNTELGYRQNWKKAALEINAFHMYYRDQLAPNGQLNDVGAALRINIPHSYRMGLELSGGFQVAPGLSLQGNATLSQNKIRGFQEFVDVYDADFNWQGQTEISRKNSDLALSPNVLAGGELRWEPFHKATWLKDQKLSLSFLTRHVGKQFIDNASDEANILPAYQYSDLRLQYVGQGKVFKKMEFSFWLQNIFNTMYSSNAWSYRYQLNGAFRVDQGFFPQAGRNLMLGVNLEI